MKGRNVQLPAVHVYSQCGAHGVRGVRGAVFRDIALGLLLNCCREQPLAHCRQGAKSTGCHVTKHGARAVRCFVTPE